MLSLLWHNQLFAGGFLLMISGAVMGLCRHLPADLWYFLQRKFSVSVEVRNDDRLFYFLQYWFDNHPYSKAATQLQASTREDTEEDLYAPSPNSRKWKPPLVIFSPAVGEHLVWYLGQPIWVSHTREDAPAGGGSLTKKAESFRLRFLGKSQEKARKLLEETLQFGKPNYDEHGVPIYTYYGGWQFAAHQRPRPLESVFLPEGRMESLVADCKDFLASRKWYEDRGIPYRRGWLFEGIPGTGKTTTVIALACHLEVPIYILNLSSSNLSDEAFRFALQEIPSRAILLLEDVDAAFKNREKVSNNNSLTFSGLLNAVDGVGGSDGRLLFMTTNHLEKLDEALIRPGRIDIREEFSYADKSQIRRAFRRFFPEANDREVEKFWIEEASPKKITMCEVQEKLIALSLGNRNSKKIVEEIDVSAH